VILLKQRKVYTIFKYNNINKLYQTNNFYPFLGMDKIHFEALGTIEDAMDKIKHTTTL